MQLCLALSYTWRPRLLQTLPIKIFTFFLLADDHLISRRSKVICQFYKEKNKPQKSKRKDFHVSSPLLQFVIFFGFTQKLRTLNPDECQFSCIGSSSENDRLDPDLDP